MQTVCSRLESQLLSVRNGEGTNFANVAGEVFQRISRKQNIIVSGLQETNNDNLEERVRKDMVVLQDIVRELGIQDSEALKSAQRIGKIQKGKPRLLRVECSSADTQSDILRASKNLMKSQKYPSVYLNPDLTFEQRREGRRLRLLLRERRAAGEDAVIHRSEVISREMILNFPQSS